MTNTARKTPDPYARIRKLGERQEMVNVRLTEGEIEDKKTEAMELMNQKDRLEERLKEIKSNYKAQFDAIKLQMIEVRDQVKSRERVEEALVEEWLTETNQVLRFRADTGEIIGDLRAARSSELQEKLFKEGPPPTLRVAPEPIQPRAPSATDDSDLPSDRDDSFGADS